MKRHLLWIVRYTVLLGMSTIACAVPEKINNLDRMQNFHIRQAEEKISKQQFAHAWGDLAYILCCVPNHHLAFKYMALIAPKLKREQELVQYFKLSLENYPQDHILQKLYQDFVASLTDKKSL